MPQGLILLLLFPNIWLVLWMIEKRKRKRASEESAAFKTQMEADRNEFADQIKSAKSERDELIEKYSAVIDAEARAAEIDRKTQELFDDAEAKAKDTIAEAESTAKSIVFDANTRAAETKKRAQLIEDSANEYLQKSREDADRMIADAKEKAKEIAGDAIEAKGKADEYEERAMAMKRIIDGYGDEWLKPSYSLLDELADEFSYTDAGQKLKEARAHSARMVKAGVAANCEYAENTRRIQAIQFVVDAFNGKVDSILSKTKQDNYGILEQKIKDAFQLVNKNGAPFRNAHILPEYLDARLEELKWATITQELKAKAAEEQRAIRERMREEEKARREYERAQREAEKEEAMLKKAMERAREMLAAASEEQKAKYEAQLLDLSERLKEAEEKGQRALSMAQQTKHGTVYVISNIGSFGENVYKVGMTRRLDPSERVRELGDASVPFPFDVHAFIESDDAPGLENELHKELSLMQVNKVNPRKEFFRVPLAAIKALTDGKGLNVNWTMASRAAEYKETLAIEERLKNDPAELARWKSFMDAASDEEMYEEQMA